ncbi:MAG: ribbon-helix-helix domain-containing protein [Egibacteraceae bacterium]
MTSQLALRIPDELAQQLDGLVAEGRFATRTDAVREAIRELLDRERRRRIDEAIVAGYRRIPPTEEEERWAAAAGRDMIAEEPW